MKEGRKKGRKEGKRRIEMGMGRKRKWREKVEGKRDRYKREDGQTDRRTDGDKKRKRDR